MKTPAVATTLAAFLAALPGLWSLPEPARADPPPLPAWDTAATLPAGDVTVGIFSPLRWGLSDTIELEIPPLVSLIAPSPLLRVTHIDRPDIRITGEYGLSYPSLLFGLARGFLFPSGPTSGDLQHHLVPHLGFIGTTEIADGHAFSVRGSLAFGLPLTGGNVNSPGSFLAPFEVLVAPMFRQYHLRLAASWDGALSDTFRARSTFAVHRVGDQPADFAQSSPWLISWHGAVDMRIGQRSRLTLGLMWWNLDNFRTELVERADGTSRRVRVRSNEFYPTFDYIQAF